MSPAKATIFCPIPGTYAVAQPDVQSTVQDLDPDAQEAAKQIKPAQCLIYLHTPLELPFPRRPWFKYITYIVGPKLCAEDRENCFTPEMCVPIFPNNDHPKGRPAVRPKTPFPFSNCSHWAYVDLPLRISAGEYPGSMDDPGVTRLPGREQLDMDMYLTEDLEAAVLAQRTRDGPQLRRNSDGEVADIFTWNAEVLDELLPVVKVSLDLAGTVDERNLPDPMDFLRQCNAIITVVKESEARKKARC